MTQKQALILSVTAAIAWGTSYLFMKIGLAGVPPMTIVALRCTIAFVVAAPFFFRRLLRVDRRTLVHSAVLGALLAVVFLCLLYGVAGTSASAAGFLVSTTVVFVPLIQMAVSRHLPPVEILLSIAVVTAGLFLMNGGDLSGMDAGALFCLLGGLLYAVDVLLTDRFVKGDDAISLWVLQLGFAGAFAGAGAFLFERPVLPQTTAQWGAILGLAVLCSAYGFIVQTVVQQVISAEAAGFLVSLEPVFSALFGFIFLQERLSFMATLGAALILLSVFVANSDFITRRLADRNDHVGETGMAEGRTGSL